MNNLTYSKSSVYDNQNITNFIYLMFHPSMDGVISDAGVYLFSINKYRKSTTFFSRRNVDKKVDGFNNAY